MSGREVGPVALRLLAALALLVLVATFWMPLFKFLCRELRTLWPILRDGIREEYRVWAGAIRASARALLCGRRGSGVPAWKGEEFTGNR